MLCALRNVYKIKNNFNCVLHIFGKFMRKLDGNFIRASSTKRKPYMARRTYNAISGQIMKS